MGGANSGVSLGPDDIYQIGVLYDEDPEHWTCQQLADSLDIVKSTVAKYLRIKKNDPAKWRELIAGAAALEWDIDDEDEQAYIELKKYLLNDWEWIATELRGLTIEPFHRKAWDLGEKNQQSLLMMPRGWGKSELAQIRAIQQTLRSAEVTRLIEKGEKVPNGWWENGAGAIISATDKMAQRLVGVVKSFLETAPVRHIWGNFVGAKWTKGELTIAQRTRPRLDPTLVALSVGSSDTTGLHPDWVMLDDIVTYQNSKTHNSRQDTKKWIATTLEGICKPDTIVWINNTPYHPEDAIEGYKDIGYKTYILPAWTLRKDKTRKSNWAGYSPVVSGLREIDGKKVKGLEDKKREMDLFSAGSFSAQMLMNTSEIKERRLDMSRVKGIQRDQLPPDLYLLQFCDFAWTARSTSDWSAIATLGYDKKDRDVYLIRCRRAKMSPKLIQEMVTAEFEEYKPRWIGIELTGLYEKEAKEVMTDLAGLPWKPVSPRGDKETRALHLQNLLELGKFYAVKDEPWYYDVKTEGEAFPSKDRHDDQIDAICQGIILIKKMHGTGTQAPKMNAFGKQIKGSK